MSPEPATESVTIKSPFETLASGAGRFYILLCQLSPGRTGSHYVAGPYLGRPRASPAGHATVVVLEAHDVVLTGVGAALYLDDYEVLVMLVADPVRRPDANLDDLARPARPSSRPSIRQVATPATTIQCSDRCACVWYESRLCGRTSIRLTL